MATKSECIAQCYGGLLRENARQAPPSVLGESAWIRYARVPCRASSNSVSTVAHLRKSAAPAR